MPLIHALGTTVQVDLGEGIECEEFTSAWSRCLRAASGGPELDKDKTPIVTGHGSMTRLTQAITRALIARRAGELMMLHAGAVSHPVTGRSIAYVAPGGTGKTTLTHLLGQEFGYLTDETVGVEPGTWRIWPYEKPLSTRTTQGGLPKTERGPDEVGLRPAHAAPRLSTLVLLRRSPGLGGANIQELALLDAITALAPETSSLSRLPKPLHLLADLYEDLGGIWQLEYSEADQLLDWIAQRLEGP